jgi:putative ABC transport system ATP-binding protein
MLRHIFSHNSLTLLPGGEEIHRRVRPSAATPAAEPLVVVRGLIKTYTNLGSQVTALKGIDLEVYPGEFLLISGKSGSGKTTLVNMISGLDRCSSGEIWVLGAPLHRMNAERLARWRGQSVGVIFQTFELLPTLTLLQNVTLPMDFAHCYSLRQQKERAMSLLEQVGIADHARKLPVEISGGQQQRVAIARALANDPAILIADEPTGSLDSHTAETMLDIFSSLIQGNRSVILVSHDRDIARRATRTLQLLDGEVVP